ncbi:transposase [Burkholderia gladioli]|uniref:transposase n=1 Tax=Burkholderia gladioli TaxID=28095 RepID=UPI003C7A07A9
MSAQRFTPEFKQEAVRQITERGYSVAEVSARLAGPNSTNPMFSTAGVIRWMAAALAHKSVDAMSEMSGPKK